MEVELCQGLPKALFLHLWHPGIEIQLDPPIYSTQGWKSSWIPPIFPSGEFPPQVPVQVEIIPNPKLKEELNNPSNFCLPQWLLQEAGWENSVGPWIDIAPSGMPEGEHLENYPRDCSLWEEF